MANSKQKEWATSGIDLLLELPQTPGAHLRARIEAALREAIRSGRLLRGARLPPTRTLARDLGISRGTLLEVYAQLAAEGWITGRQGSSTVVSVQPGPPAASPVRMASPTRMRFDLRPGRPDPSSFPRAEWLRALRRVLALASNDAFGYGSPQGQLSLRNQLAGYLARARGLWVTPEDVVITSGFTQALGLVARAVTGRRSPRIAMEEPSMSLHRSIVRAAGAELLLVAVDDEGLRVEELEAAGHVDLVVVTPNRQHPTGVTLSPARRSRLLAWARAGGSLILEDDYDGEFRYDRRPIGPLQGLDPEVVIHSGTASKTLAPAVRLGWLVSPRRLRQELVRQKELADWHSSTLEQLAFSEMLVTAAYDRHIRKMRRRYQQRRDTLLTALHAVKPGLAVHGIESGLNLLISVSELEVEAAALSAARKAGVGIDGLATGGYFEHHPSPGILIGYAASPEHAFRSAIETLVSSIEPHLG
jgi:GntR family transcriptional regulator / MocR family aminotransferase